MHTVLWLIAAWTAVSAVVGALFSWGLSRNWINFEERA